MNENKDSGASEIEWVWSIVGNIATTREYGENKEIRQGTKHFSPGTKVYCLPLEGFGGMGWEDIVVMGKPRRQFRLIKVVIQRKWIINFRLKKVWDKRVIKAMNISDQNANEAYKERALRFIDSFNGELKRNELDKLRKI